MKVTSLFGRNLPVSQGPLGPRVQAEIDAKTAELATLRQSHGRLAFAVATGGENASLELHQHRAAVSALEADIADLRAAHTVAMATDNEAAAKRRLAIHASRVASLRQHLAARHRSAMKLSAAIENAAVEYMSLIEGSEKIAGLLEAEGLPHSSLLPLRALREAIAYEVFRVAPGPVDSMRQFPLRFPGGQAPDIFQQGNPSGLQPLAEAIKEAGARLLAQIGAVPAASQAPVPSSPSQSPVPSSAEAQPIDAADVEAVQTPSQLAPEPAPRMPTAAELDAETLRSGPRFVALPLASVRLNPNDPAPVDAP